VDVSLVVQALQIDQHGARIAIAQWTAAGFERWRTDVWASKAVTAVAETVRRPRPSRLILPSLAVQDILVEGEELDQLEREVDAVLAQIVEVVREIDRAGPLMIGAMLGGVPIGNADSSLGKPVAPLEAEVVEHFRARLHNIKEAVQLARTVPRGAVMIS
jgi:hypothetical protein